MFLCISTYKHAFIHIVFSSIEDTRFLDAFLLCSLSFEKTHQDASILDEWNSASDLNVMLILLLQFVANTPSEIDIYIYILKGITLKETMKSRCHVKQSFLLIFFQITFTCIYIYIIVIIIIMLCSKHVYP